MEREIILIDLSYQILEEKKELSFFEIWEEVKKRANISDADEARYITNLHTSMMSSSKFFFKHNEGVWCLRKEVTLAEIKKQMTMYTIENDETFTSNLDTKTLEFTEEYITTSSFNTDSENLYEDFE